MAKKTPNGAMLMAGDTFRVLLPSGTEVTFDVTKDEISVHLPDDQVILGETLPTGEKKWVRTTPPPLIHTETQH